MTTACGKKKPAFIGCASGDDPKASWRAVTTEYSKEYQKWPSQEKQLIRPPSNGELIYDASARHDMKTMYEDNYVNHPTAARMPCVRPQQDQLTKPGYLQCLSTYKDNYRNTGLLQMRKAFRPCPTDSQFGVQSGGGEKFSVSHQAYRAYNKEESMAAKRNPILIKETGGVIPDEVGGGMLRTIAQESFKKPQRQDRRQLIVPASAEDVHRCCRMDLITTNRADFNHKVAEPCPPARALIRERGGRTNLQLGTFDMRSTFQDDYIKHPYAQRPKPFKPPQQCQESDTPFLTNTIYRDDYKRFPNQGPPPRPHKLQGTLQLPESCSFQGRTQYTDEFIRPSPTYKRQKFVKPETARAIQGKFYDETQYRANYQQFQLSQPRKMFFPAQTYEPPTIPFQFESTAHAHYKGETAPRSKICRPVANPRINDVKCVCIT